MPAAIRWLLRLGPMNPIVVRLVQGASRRPRHNLIRSGYLFVLITVLLLLLLPSHGQELKYQVLAAKGASAFEIVAYLQVALICILSPVFMAGAIAQESNPRTWEVLLTTPLNSLQMVLGQLIGRLFFVLGLLAASLPLFAITQYFGGVPGSSILLSYAVAMCAALVVGAVAVTLAVNRLAGRRAVFAFYVSVVTYLAVTIAIDSGIGSGRVTWMTALNPFLALRSLLNPTGYPRPDVLELAAMPWLQRFWLGDPVGAWCAVSGLLSLILVAVSATTVRSIGSAEGSTRRRWLSFGSRSSSGGRAHRPVSMNPIAWREASARQDTLPKLILRWSFIAAGALWGLALVLYYHGGGMTHDTFRFVLLVTVWTEMTVIMLIAINTSATSISREREDGTLDLLLTTPLTPKTYLWGKLRGLISYLTPLLAVPLGTVALAALYTLAGGFGRVGGVVSKDVIGAVQLDIPVVLPEAAIVVPMVSVSFIAFCVMVGLQWSVKSKGTIGSVVSTVGAVGVLAGIAGLCGWQAGVVVSYVGPALSASTPMTALLSSVQTADAFANSNISGAADLAIARTSLVIGSVLASLVYWGIVLGILRYLLAERARGLTNFHFMVRKLSGTN